MPPASTNAPVAARLALIGLVFFMTTAHANSVVWVTPSNAMVQGGAVSAEADFTVDPVGGMITVVLKNLQADIQSAGQLVSDLFFKVSNISASTNNTSISSQNATLRTITTNGIGGWSDTVAPVAINWGLDFTDPMGSVAGGIHLNGLGQNKSTSNCPQGNVCELIVGPPAPNGAYSATNSSIVSNTPHNPFSALSATFKLAVSGLTTGSTINSVEFSFSTSTGYDLAGHQSPVPEPSGYVWLAGLAGFGMVYAARRLAAGAKNSQTRPSDC
jgi:hypothetical protein